MIATLEKKKEKKNKLDKNVNNHMKKIVRTYLDLGLIDGYIDKDGKTVLPKESFDDWD